MPKRTKVKRHRSYGITWNNYPDDWRKLAHCLFDLRNTRFLVCGKEVGESGTPHLQCHIDFHNGMTITAFQKKLKKLGIKCSVSKYESAKHTENGRQYCYKDEDWEEWGDKPDQGARNDICACMAAIRTDPTISDLQLMETHETVMAKYPKFVDKYRSLRWPPEDLEHERHETPNLWIYGPPGTGKSHFARNYKPSFYSKPLNKWWDNYNNQTVAILEDVEPTQASWLGYFLKIWGDKYTFHADMKHSGRSIRPKIIIVTSNYHIRDMGFDPVKEKAILERFKCKEMNTKYVPGSAPPEGSILSALLCKD